MTGPLDGIDLVIFDKDGTLIAFDAMWRDWAMELGERLSQAIGHEVRPPLYEMLGFDTITGLVTPHGGLAATPMARLRDMTRAVLVADGASPGQASAAVDQAWHAPDPVTLARPLAPLRPLLEGLRAAGKRVAIATSDDRDPTERTLRALDVDDLVDATVCADDGFAVKPAPDMVLQLCAQLGVDPGRAAVVGDSPADLRMGRAAGAGLVVGVLSGVGETTDLATLADLVVGSIEQLRIG